MGALQIDCYCNDWQMNSIVKLIRKNIYDNANLDEGIGDNISDEFNNIPFTVKFEDTTVEAVVDEVSIKNKEGKQQFYDSVVLQQRLEKIIEKFNEDLKNARKRQYQDAGYAESMADF